MPDDITNLIPVPVHGHTLFVADDPTPWVPIRPICQALGIDDKTQRRKLQSHPTFAPVGGEMTSTGPDGKTYKMFSLPAPFAMGWLLNIHPDKVAPKVRATLVAFQRDAFNLLWEAYTAVRHGLPLHPGGRPSGDLFAQAPHWSSWYHHPGVQQAVSLGAQARSLMEKAKDQARELRRQARGIAARAGLKAPQLDLLTGMALLPPAPAVDQGELPLEREG